ncbi:hypothetical protein B0G57_10763 [Trinickia symbiotica]|uniref:Uncharacterized protein n=1 Tax=Trinickia symbiotica TaxID=863227 RepID=A0A2N7X4C9_9BURK|nr:hypothetical protein C0Z20_13265 [Trinickia symbiotica]PPK44744.1 hypothetical protein B0G57_10763 [Trinickia symbiotica]
MPRNITVLEISQSFSATQNSISLNDGCHPAPQCDCALFPSFCALQGPEEKSIITIETDDSIATRELTPNELLQYLAVGSLEC